MWFEIKLHRSKNGEIGLSVGKSIPLLASEYRNGSMGTAEEVKYT